MLTPTDPISGFIPGLDTWIISDTHFFHENIARYCDRPDGWQDLIVANWNRLISTEETVFHLGDLALGKREQAEALIPTLNGKIHLMRGNHDRRGRAFFESLGIRLVKDPLILELEPWPRLIFSHRPVFPLPPGALNLHGHIHNNPHPADPKGLGDLWGRYVNMSVEVRDYRPWRLREVLPEP